MQIDDAVLRSFKMARIFKPAIDPTEKDEEPPPRFNSLSFHRTQDLLAAATDNDTIIVYDTYNGVEHSTTLSRKYGVANICFCHDPHSVIYSSVKGNHAWRYHDLEKNKYVRYFEGHTGRVTTLCQSPKTDFVLSAAEDKQVRMWDLREGRCVAMLEAPGLPTVTWDEQGLVFGVAAEKGITKLYDARNFSSGPFVSFEVEEEINSNALFASLRFSLDGKTLLAVVENRIYALDAFTGRNLLKTGNPSVDNYRKPYCDTLLPEGQAAVEACLTADGKYILSGCGDRHIRAWRVTDGVEIAKWKQHEEVPTCLKFSPRKMLVASASRSLALWIPDLKELAS